MGFPVCCADVFIPKFTVHILSLVGFIQSAIFSLLRFLAISDILEPDASFHRRDSPTRTRSTENPPFSAVVMREFLSVVKFSDVQVAEAEPESCAICLYEFEGAEEMRCLTNCDHIFHRRCLDRWMDHDRSTCPLCRAPILPPGCRDEYEKRLWAAYGLSDFYGD